MCPTSCACMCTCLCTCVYDMCIYLSGYTCPTVHRGRGRVSSYITFHLIPLRKGLFLTLALAFSRWRPSKPQRSSCLRPSHLWCYRGMWAHTQLDTCILNQTQVFMLTQQALLPPEPPVGSLLFFALLKVLPGTHSC